MGLDISAGDYGFRAGSYSGFNSFRNWLAQKLGFKNLSAYYSKYDPIAGTFNHNNGTYTKANKVPLGPLMMHSDCDGEISPNRAKKLLSDLQIIKANLKPLFKNKPKSKKSIEKHADEKYFRESLNHWILACEESIVCDEPIHFA